MFLLLLNQHIGELALLLVSFFLNGILLADWLFKLGQ